MTIKSRPLVLLVLAPMALFSASSGVFGQESKDSASLDVVRVFSQLVEGKSDQSVEWLDANWQKAYFPMIVDALRVLPEHRLALAKLLETKSGQALGGNITAWFDWIWKQDIDPDPLYADVKSVLYGTIDPRFGPYFDSKQPSLVRLDEVRWGGVLQDGIPPLRAPKMIDAKAATYLADSDVVFGIEVNGDFRAYPNRILAWHEMFTDEVGGIDLTGVY